MTSRDTIVIGGSTGAIDVLKGICAGLPADLPAAVLAVVHVGSEGHDHLAPILGRDAALPAATATDGMPAEPGRIHVAPAGHHLLLMGDTIRLDRGPRENLTRPAADPLFRSAAASRGSRVIGVVLSGMLNDGAAGLAAVKRCGGLAVVQNPADARAAEMPYGALLACEVDYRAPAAELGVLLAGLAGQPAGPTTPAPADIGLEVAIALGQVSDTSSLLQIADPSVFSCPDCGGVLSEMKDKDPLRFRCQVGHAYTAAILDQVRQGAADEALMVALRIIEERVALSDRLAADACANGRHRSAAMFEERAREYRDHAALLRRSVLRLPS